MESIDIGTLADLAEFVGGIGVIASLIFLALQMRENNLNIKEANFRQVMSRNVEMGRLIGGDKRVANVFRRGCENMMELDEDERWQFGSLMIALFCDFNEQYNLHLQNRLDESYWTAIEHNMKFYLDRPGVKMWWDNVPFELDAKYVQYVNDYLASVQPQQRQKNRY